MRRRFILQILISTLQLLMGSASFGAPLCSVVLLHTSPLLETVSDLRHAGAVDINLRIEKNNLFAARTVRPMQPNSNPPNQVSLEKIHFMQNGISSKFAKDKGSVLELARDLRDGRTKLNELPPIRVWKDQNEKIWTLDHRRLAAYILSGKIEKANVQWASPEVVQKDSFKLKNQDGGDSMLLYLTSELSLVVARPQAFSKSGFNIPSRLQSLKVNSKEALRIQEQLSGLKVKDLVLIQDVPKFEAPGKSVPLRNTTQSPLFDKSSLQSQEYSSNIHFSKRALTNADARQALTLARQIKTNTLSGPLELSVWRDAHQRLWTSDNIILAAFRMADYQHQIPVKQAGGLSDLTDSQTGGRSILLELPNSSIALVID